MTRTRWPARLARAADERRLLVWSANPDLQTVLEAHRAVRRRCRTTSAPYAGLTIINEGGNKLDYYLDRALTWHRDGLRPRPDRDGDGHV